jgi:hypothetical protein
VALQSSFLAGRVAQQKAEPGDESGDAREVQAQITLTLPLPLPLTLSLSLTLALTLTLALALALTRWRCKAPFSPVG